MASVPSGQLIDPMHLQTKLRLYWLCWHGQCAIICNYRTGIFGMASVASGQLIDSMRLHAKLGLGPLVRIALHFGLLLGLIFEHLAAALDCSGAV